MALHAVFSGFSIALILPITQKVFMRSDTSTGTPVHVGEGLRKTWGRVVDALGGAGAWNDRLAAAKDAGVAGLSDIQNNASPLEILTWLCFIALGAVFFKNLSDYGRKVAFIRVEQAAVEALRNDIFRRILHFPLSTMNRISSGQFISRTVTDIEFVKSLTISNVANFVHNLFLVTVYLSISVWASYQLALASLLIVPVVGLLTGKLASKLRRHSARAQARIAELTGSLSETLGGIRIVKAFGTENREQSRFAATTSQYRSAVVRLLSLDRLAAPLSEFWGVAIGLGVLYYGGQLLLAPEPSITTGRFFVFLFALVSMLHPLKQLTNVVTGFQRGAVAANRVFEILEMDIETDDPNPLPLPGIEKELTFENVSFLYEPEQPVLHEVSFSAPVGTTTAVVGPSGAGKSTLVDLIPRFYKPDSGRILIDGTDLERVRRSELRALIGIVSQESILFNDTVMNNIAYGSDSPTREAVIEAAQAANAHEFIETMPRGYDTVIGERGVRLSGGQRQRLAIARAVLRNPAILILDEATSSLDTESENLVQEALERLLAGRTTFVIAHRLSTVVQADRILVLDQGRIVQTGTHTELATRPGLYNRLYTLQFRTDEAPRLDAVES
jgi:subfamily B ATP-binding cassette protein MsbA